MIFSEDFQRGEKRNVLLSPNKSISSSLEAVSSEVWVSLEPYSKLIQGGRDEKPHLAALQVPPDNQCNSELQARPALPEPFRHQRPQQQHVGKFSNQIRVQKAHTSFSFIVLHAMVIFVRE